MNNTIETKCYIKLWGKFHMLFFGIILGFILFHLNVLIIITILRTKSLHSNTNIFILSIALLGSCMAINDSMQGVVTSTDLKFNKHVTNIADAVLLGTGTSAVTISCTHMAIVAIDRYINIAHPFYYILNITKRRIIVVLIIVWLCGLVYCSIPPIFYRDGKYHVHCITSHPPMEYFIISASLGIIEYFIIFICYFKISQLAFKHKKAANARRLQTENPDNVLASRGNRTAAFKSVKFFVCLFGSFFVFTFSPFVTTAMAVFSYEISEKIVLLIIYFSEMHSFVNFIVYIHFNNGFSRGIKKLFSDMTSFCKLLRLD